ncbi:alpha/beta fold hydrolase [Cohnella lubricantis]|uniref:Alpha/beta fold hydrolase n=1 Tax=Cohnella lubricantis TaxID=2163172 RepID=A0A841T8Y5_9BACL|nr:alpha/beta fold hydrolase [Cohnella lubricantis]MBB6677973.1 alpha/beta fold hydrolase [Cohnella lubricantis]MBP2119959.1 pimeloyl-ACP methyl ester carboxylesterase [Cohnella lubricantis]
MPIVTLANSLQAACADEGAGTPVLLLHGYCGSRHYWDDVLPLLNAKFRIIAPDCRGHGETQATNGAYPMEQLAEDAVQLLDELGIPKAYVLGHSMGGYTALALAEKYPDRVLGLGLLHSTTFPDDENGKAGRDAAARRIALEGIKGHIDDLVPKLFAPEHRTSMRSKLSRATVIGYGTSPLGAIGGALGMKERPDRRSILEQFHKPVLLLAGEEDGVIAPEKRFPASGPNVTQVLLSGSGHMGMMEAPEAFANAIASFIETSEGRRNDV